MTEFNNVTIVKKANMYFGGKVTSRKVVFTDGTFKTLGIMLEGDYEFGTAEKEIMEIISGELDVLIDDKKGWEKITDGGIFEVPANSKFKLKIKRITDYCCSYIK